MYKVNFIIEELEKGNISDVFVKVYQKYGSSVVRLLSSLMMT